MVKMQAHLYTSPNFNGRHDAFIVLSVWSSEGNEKDR